MQSSLTRDDACPRCAGGSCSNNIYALAIAPRVNNTWHYLAILGNTWLVAPHHCLPTAPSGDHFLMISTQVKAIENRRKDWRVHLINQKLFLQTVNHCQTNLKNGCYKECHILATQSFTISLARDGDLSKERVTANICDELAAAEMWPKIWNIWVEHKFPQISTANLIIQTFQYFMFILQIYRVFARLSVIHWYVEANAPWSCTFTFSKSQISTLDTGH